MPEDIQEVVVTPKISSLNINGNVFDLKDLEAQELLSEIIEAIGANNNDIAEHINNLHDRSFDTQIKIYSSNDSEIANINDGIYKLQYVTITSGGDNPVETLNNSAILIQTNNNQYLYKDGQISSRTKENNIWGIWVVNQSGVTSVNGQTGAVTVSGLPTVTSTDNGKILMVVNGQWQLVSPSTLYSGSGVPNNSQGNNGDIYVQTD